MKRALLLCVALAIVVAAVLFATCEERHDADEVARAPSDRVDSPKTLPLVRRGEADAPTVATSESEVDHSTVPDKAASVLTVWPPGVVVAAPRHVLRGRVVNHNGKPLRGLDLGFVSAWLPADVVAAEGRYAAASATTGPEGTFELPYFEGGPRGLFVNRYSPIAPIWYGQGLGDEEFHEIVIDDHQPDVTVCVTRAADGTEIADASVRLVQCAMANVPWPPNPAYTEWGQSRPAPGTFVYDGIAAGPATLTVSAPGFARIEKQLLVPRDTAATVKIAMKSAVVVRGVVLDDAEAPVPRATVGERGWCDHDTDERGRFTVDDATLRPGAFRSLVACADGFPETEFLVGGLDASATECDVVVRLRRAAAVTARCLDADGNPLMGQLAVVESDYDGSRPEGQRTTFTSTAASVSEADGRVALYSIHPGTDGLTFRARFYLDGVPVLERSYPPLRAGETRDLGDVVLAPGFTLRGTVLDADGKPVAGATVVAAAHDADDETHAAIGSAVISQGGRRAETQPDGTFALMGLTKGLWDLYASADVASPGRLSIGVDPAAGDVTLRLPRVVALEGRVVDAKGSPVAKADVRSVREEFGLRTIVSCGTGDDGRFSVPGFDADAPEVEVSVKPPGGAAQKFTARPGVPTTELRLR